MENIQKISIITVCLNSASYFELSIKSVLSQTYHNIEYVIIDGGSTDGTVEIVENYQDGVDYFVSEPDGGLYNAMNKGIKAATGDVLFFLNSDDYFADDKIVEDVMRVFKNQPDIDIVYGDQIFDFGDRQFTKRQPHIVTREHLARTTIQHQTVFARRKVFDLTGGFSEKYKIVSDFEWMLKVFVKNKCSHIHVNRDVSVMSMQGLSCTTNFEPERRSVMREYFNIYETYRYRVLPLMLKKLIAGFRSILSH